MDTVFIAFANNDTDKLHSLTKEDQEVNSILSKLKSERKIDFIREQTATTPKIAEALYLYQQQLSVFLYSGHAGRDFLLLEDQAANPEGLAAFFQRCPKLKLVILNGCSTEGQVQILLDSGVPIVIATSAPVGDMTATQFSIAFFRSFASDTNSIDKAFKDGLAAAKLVSATSIEARRGIVKNRRSNQAVWGVFFKPENELYLEWCLGKSSKPKEDKFIPSKLLLDAIWDAIYPFVQGKKEKSTYKDNDIIDEIITNLPHPISDYLRKLIASKRIGEKEIFYNELGVDRLKYLIHTYTNCIDILAFTLLAQLWDEKSKGSLQELPKALRQQLQKLFDCNFRERKTYSLLPVITGLRKCFEENEIPFFIKEFAKLSKLFNEKGSFYKACIFIERIRAEIINKEHIAEEKAYHLCIDIEKQLSIIMRELGFLAKYKMASMKGIDFIKYKHNISPRFRHNFVELRYRPSGMNIEKETLEASMNNESVVFIHEKADNDFEFLNLSPFIIDINSFDEKAQLADLGLFLSFEPNLSAFLFRYMYKPHQFPLRIDKSKDYLDLVHEQFNAFYQLIFQKNIEL